MDQTCQMRTIRLPAKMKQEQPAKAKQQNNMPKHEIDHNTQQTNPNH
jgi:hypothetical protein